MLLKAKSGGRKGGSQGGGGSGLGLGAVSSSAGGVISERNSASVAVSGRVVQNAAVAVTAAFGHMLVYFGFGFGYRTFYQIALVWSLSYLLFICL